MKEARELVVDMNPHMDIVSIQSENHELSFFSNVKLMSHFLFETNVFEHMVSS